MFSLYFSLLFAIIFRRSVYEAWGSVRVCVEVFSLLGCLPATAAKEKKKDRKQNLSPAIIIFVFLLLLVCTVLCAESERFYISFYFLFCYTHLGMLLLLLFVCVGEGIVSPYNLIVVFSLSCFLLSTRRHCVGGTLAHVPIISSFVGKLFILRYFAPHIWREQVTGAFHGSVGAKLISEKLCNFMLANDNTQCTEHKRSFFSCFFWGIVLLLYVVAHCTDCFVLLVRGLDHFPSPFCLLSLLCCVWENIQSLLFQEKNEKVLVCTMNVR
jgi:hypothetical protein